ncbi:MAG: hypothetical protein NVV70_06430 [Cellulomonas sp.]|nr:hypothetical protein [Cellulomonas sp.]MCR6647780.1 hypothetical protein [Cellulomonas sp.]
MTTTAHTPGGNGICGACHRPVSTGPCPEVSPAPDELPLTPPARRIYVASSWRNPDQPKVVDLLRARGFEVYDFRNPPGRSGFSWSEIDPWWRSWTAEEYIAALEHPLAVAGYASDFAAMQWADTFVLVLPCGRSAHLELGWAVGAGKRTVIITRDGEEPELMAKMVDHIAVGLDDALDYLSRPDAPAPSDEDPEALARATAG